MIVLRCFGVGGGCLAVADIYTSLIMNSRRIPFDVTGKPTPKDIIRGKWGVTHVDAHFHFPAKCFLDGMDVTNRASECDVIGGWVRMYDLDENGNIKLSDHPVFAVQHIHFGHVEIFIDGTKQV